MRELIHEVQKNFPSRSQNHEINKKVERNFSFERDSHASYLVFTEK